MKYSLVAGAILIAGSCANAHADTLLGVYVGAQIWNVETDGNFSDESSTTDGDDLQNFNFEDEVQGSFYIAFEHFVPIIPNVKLNHTLLDNSGTTDLEASFTFNGEQFDVDTSLLTTADITTTDIILYYELFDNDLFSFDLGLNGKLIDGDLIVVDEDTGTQSQESFSGIVPMLYSRAEFNLPFSGLGIYAEGSYIDIDGNSLTDFQVAIDYAVIESIALDFTLQAGYRDISLELDDIDDISSDLSFSGFFAGVEIHF